MKPPYLLRDIERFNQQSYSVSQVGRCHTFHHLPHGKNGPTLPVLTARPFGSTGEATSSGSTGAKALDAGDQKDRCWRQTPARLLIKVRNLFNMRARRYRHDRYSSRGTDAQVEFSSAYVSKWEDSVGLPTGTRCASFLTALPTEILLEIMKYCSMPTLYCLRQTSAIFKLLFENSMFEEVHLVPESGSERIGFDILSLTVWEMVEIANRLHHEMYCAPCFAAEERNVLAGKKEVLGERPHCEGCNRTHSRALFFPEDLQRHDDNSAGLLCIGRLAKITLCDHRSSQYITWQDIEKVARQHTPYKSACTDCSHQPATKDDAFMLYSSPFPRLFAQYMEDGPSVEIGYGWDLPLLRIDQTVQHTLTSLWQALSNVLVAPDTLKNYRLCPHISAGKQLRDFVSSGICQCFLGKGRSRYRFITPANAFDSCECERKITLECRVCGAVYMWLWFHEQVILSLRYMWNIHSPASFGWLNLVGKEDRERLFTQANKHILWCDTNDCWKNNGRQWESFIKVNSEREWRTAMELWEADPELEESDAASEGLFHHRDRGEMFEATEAGSFQSW